MLLRETAGAALGALGAQGNASTCSGTRQGGAGGSARASVTPLTWQRHTAGPRIMSFCSISFSYIIDELL